MQVLEYFQAPSTLARVYKVYTNQLMGFYLNKIFETNIYYKSKNDNYKLAITVTARVIKRYFPICTSVRKSWNF